MGAPWYVWVSTIVFILTLIWGHNKSEEGPSPNPKVEESEIELVISRKEIANKTNDPSTASNEK